MKTIIETLKNKWPQYVLEIFVIVIGILGAFMMDNWNSNNMEAKKEHYYLERLDSAISKQVEALELLVEFQDKMVAHSNAITNDFKASKNFIEIDGLQKRLSILLIAQGLKKHNSTYEELNATGQLSTIKDQITRTKIIEFYQSIEGADESIQSNMERVYYSQVFPVVLEVINLEVTTFFDTDQPLVRDYHTKENKEFIQARLEDVGLQVKLLNALSLVMMTNIANKSSLERAIISGNELIAIIRQQQNDK